MECYPGNFSATIKARSLALDCFRKLQVAATKAQAGT